MDDLYAMLLDTASLLQMNGQWKARALHCNSWGTGATPEEAIEQAQVEKQKCNPQTSLPGMQPTLSDGTVRDAIS